MTATGLRREVARLRADIAALRATARPAWATPLGLAEALGIALDPWQARLLRSTARRVVVKAPRQTGKTLTTAILGLHVALTTAEALVLIVSPAERQSKEVVRVVRQLAARLAIETREHDQAMAPSALSLTRIEFGNGARVLSLPGSSEATIRGYARPSLIICDEAARIPEPTYEALRPMLAAWPAGRLLLLSTPWTKTGTFYAACQDETGAWERHTVAVADCPRLDAAFLAEERASLPEHVFAREYLGEFADDEASVFAGDLVEAALSDEVAPLGLFGRPR